jgi:uncharacterized membrane protein YfcA
MLTFYISLILLAIIAGIIGSLLGIGGGIVIIPILILLYHINIREAIGASIISVIATSSGAASVYLKDKLINLKTGMFLEIATTTGAISGATLLGIINPQILFFIFAFVLIISIYPMIMKRENNKEGIQNDYISKKLELASSYTDNDGVVYKYGVNNTPYGLIMMYIAGFASGLLGIGSGVFKVIAMDDIMHIPMKVSTTTSNFMIGVTALASSVIYLIKGYINPYLALPVMAGIFIGSLLGTKILRKTSNQNLKVIFSIILLIIAIEMVLRGVGLL